MYFFPSNDDICPVKDITSLFISADAPIGAVHPPSSYFKNDRSTLTHNDVCL